MNVQLIQGQFSASDAIDLVTQMIQLKIKYHENKIDRNTREEDIKYRESKIKYLQKELSELIQHIQEKKESVNMDAIINIA